MAPQPIPPPDPPSILAPILPALPSATVSTEPALGILPLLSPILRQRVQLFSPSSTTAASSSPHPGWLHLLCYDRSKTSRLVAAVRSGALEPHPVSGHVEVDWDRDSILRFRRLDTETLQALACLTELDLAFRLVYCAGEDAWRVGELTIADGAALSGFRGFASIDEAEAQFAAQATSNDTTASSREHADRIFDAYEDDGYWDRYDATPARTPAPASGVTNTTRSSCSSTKPTPQTNGHQDPNGDDDDDDDDDDDYYAQYDHVQPAMDNRDPDEESAAAHLTRFDPPLGLSSITSSTHSSSSHPPNHNPSLNQSHSHNRPDLSPTWTAPDPATDGLGFSAILAPRPDSSASSTGAGTVAHLEASAGKQAQTEFGVRQHIGRSVRSLWALARASGIERDEFDGLVTTELELLGLADEE